MESFKVDLKKYYDLDAADRDGRTLPSWKKEVRELFLSHLKEEKMETLLEIGSGPGGDAFYFQQNGLKVTASDLSDNNIEKCQKKGLDTMMLDFYKMDLPCNHFDALYGMNCLLHVPHKDTEVVLTEIGRVVKERGIIFIGLYGGKDWEGVREEHGKRFFSFHTFDRYSRLLSRFFEIIQATVISLEDSDLDFHSFILRNSSR